MYYEDGHETPCGPRTDKQGRKHHFGSSIPVQFHFLVIDMQIGGHAAERFPIPKNDEITKVEVGVESYELNGLRFHMSGGTQGGYLYDETPIQTLGISAYPTQHPIH